MAHYKAPIPTQEDLAKAALFESAEKVRDFGYDVEIDLKRGAFDHQHSTFKAHPDAAPEAPQPVPADEELAQRLRQRNVTISISLVNDGQEGAGWWVGRVDADRWGRKDGVMYHHCASPIDGARLCIESAGLIEYKVSKPRVDSKPTVRRPLTVDEIYAAWKTVKGGEALYQTDVAFARAIESAQGVTGAQGGSK